MNRAVISHSYMENLCRGTPLSESLELYHTESYGLLECDARREILRFIISLFRFLNVKSSLEFS